MLRTKCILKEPEPHDGVRISTMSRHTLNDGRTPDPRLDSKYDEHIPLLAPPPSLVGAWYREEISWSEFEDVYRAHLQKLPVREEVDSLVRRSLYGPVTVLCIESSPQRCHRRLLAEECKRYNPELAVEVF